MQSSTQANQTHSSVLYVYSNNSNPLHKIFSNKSIKEFAKNHLQQLTSEKGDVFEKIDRASTLDFADRFQQPKENHLQVFRILYFAQE